MMVERVCSGLAVLHIADLLGGRDEKMVHFYHKPAFIISLQSTTSF
jgi:hypothetical protein